MQATRFTNGEAEYQVSNPFNLSIRTADITIQRPLSYFIGSGHTGRSYLYGLDGFLFESPASYYSTTSDWRISPGYERTSEVQLLRPVETACLNCHASRLRPVAGTLNRFESPAFDPGITCERCHGSGERHMALMKAGRAKEGLAAIVNPAKLDPPRRDSICQQCHLAGEVRIAKAGAGVWHPGEVFSDYVVTFVRADTTPTMQVNSHAERLALSKCARASGAKLWCGSCHDVHKMPAASNRIAYYRARCMSCHAQHSCSSPKTGDNCIRCHMPASSVRDVQHAVYTDHSIPRTPTPSAKPTADPDLTAFTGTATDRELGLAYTSLGLLHKAYPYLKAAARDAKVATQLAQIYDRMGRPADACELYAEVVAADPAAIKAAINLGTCKASQGDLNAAITLWKSALTRAPGEESARLNLAVALYRTGDREGAAATLHEALRFNPASTQARTLLSEISPPPGPR